MKFPSTIRSLAVISVSLLFGIAGIIYSTYQKPKYESRLTFSLDAGSINGSLSGALNLAAQFGLGVDMGQGMFDGDNIIEIMKSRRMIECVLLSVDTFDNKPGTLIQHFIDQSEFGEILKKKPLLASVNFPVGIQKENMTYLQDSILFEIYQKFIKENISAQRPDKKLSIYEVRVTSYNEHFSKVFTDRIVDSTDGYYITITSKKDLETLKILESRVASIKLDVSESIETRASELDQNINPAFARVQTQAMKQQYNTQAYSEAYKEMFKTLEMARYQYLKKIPLLQIIDHANYPMKRIKSGKTKAFVFFFFLGAAIATLFILLYKSILQKLKQNHLR